MNKLFFVFAIFLSGCYTENSFLYDNYIESFDYTLGMGPGQMISIPVCLVDNPSRVEVIRAITPKPDVILVNGSASEDIIPINRCTIVRILANSIGKTRVEFWLFRHTKNGFFDTGGHTDLAVDVSGTVSEPVGGNHPVDDVPGGGGPHYNPNSTGVGVQSH